MNSNVSTLERAFALAASGKFDSITSLKKMLRAEGYDHAQIFGRALHKQLTDLMVKAAAPS